MRFVKNDSLAGTVEAVLEAEFSGKWPSVAERRKAALFIAGRLGQSGAYLNGLAAPTDRDRLEGFRLFTGEWIRTKAGIGHILGEEAARAMVVLDVNEPIVDAAVDAARDAMSSRIGNGWFCCSRCSVAAWRFLSVSGAGYREVVLESGLRILRERRTPNGGWGAFPFYYTVYALLGIDLPEAKQELLYAASKCQRLLKRPQAPEPYGARKSAIYRKVLELV